MRRIVLLLSLGLSVMLQAQQIPLQKDAWIWSMPNVRNINFGVANAQNQGLNNVIRAEAWQWQTNRDDTIRSLIYFDIDSLDLNKVDSAFLRLKFFSNPNFTRQSGANAFRLHPINEAWTESTVTWNNQPAYVDSFSISAAASLSDTQSYRIRIDSLLTYMKQHNSQGIMLRLVDESPFKSISFSSREHSNPSLHPYLLIYSQSSLSLDEEPFPEPQFSNPFFNELQIEWSGEAGEQLQVFDSAGKLRYEGPLDNTLQIETADWPMGYYILHINGRSYSSLKHPSYFHHR